MRRLGVTQNTTRFLVKRPSWFVELRLTPGQGAAFFILLAMLCSGASVSAATVSAYETEQLYHAGKFEECREIAADQVRKGVWNELWPELLMRCHHTLGEYEAAVDVFESNLGRFGNRLAFRMAGVQAYRLVNRADKAKTQEETIFKMVQSAPWRFSSVRDQVNQHYHDQGFLATEHPMIDDNGDRTGTTAGFFRGIRVARRSSDTHAVDGKLAHQWTIRHISREPELEAESKQRRDQLESQLEQLRRQKETISEDDYYAQIEPLLVELATLYESEVHRQDPSVRESSIQAISE